MAPRLEGPRTALAHLRPYSGLGPPVEVRILSLSPGGARIAHAQLLRPGFLCALSFPLRRPRLTLSVQVVYTEVVALGLLRYETGLAFVQVDPAQQAILQELLWPERPPEEGEAGLLSLSPN